MLSKEKDKSIFSHGLHFRVGCICIKKSCVAEATNILKYLIAHLLKYTAGSSNLKKLLNNFLLKKHVRRCFSPLSLVSVFVATDSYFSL